MLGPLWHMLRQLRSWARSLCPCCATTGISSDSAESQFIEGRCFPSWRRGKPHGRACSENHGDSAFAVCFLVVDILLCRSGACPLLCTTEVQMDTACSSLFADTSCMLSNGGCCGAVFWVDTVFQWCHESGTVWLAGRSLFLAVASQLVLLHWHLWCYGCDVCSSSWVSGCLWISCPLSRGMDVPRSSGGVCGVSLRWSVPSSIRFSTDRARRSHLPSVGSQLVPAPGGYAWISRVARRPLMSLWQGRRFGALCLGTGPEGVMSTGTWPP